MQLKSILQGKSVDVYKKIVEDKLKTLEKEIKNISPRIDELMLALPKKQPDYSATEAELQQHKNELADIEAKLSDTMNLVNEYSGIQQILSKLKLKLENVKANIDADVGEDRKQLIIEKAELLNGKMLLESGISNLKASIAQIQNNIKNNKAQRLQLVNEWEELTKEKKSILGEEFIEPDEDNFICPTCGQDLPEDAKEQKISELQENFQADKNKRLAEVEGKIKQNVAKGKSVRNTLEQAQTKALEQQKELEEKQKQLKEVKAKLSQIEEKLSKPTPEPDYNSNEEYASLQKQIQVLQTKLDEPQEDKSSELLMRKSVIQLDIDKCNYILNNKTAAENIQKRIDELKSEEKNLAQQITELEGHKYLIEQFNIEKVNMLEDKINSRFKHVRFKLFEQQLNGNIVEICQALVNTNGVYVPFDDANHAGKVNAGLDIINSLCSITKLQHLYL